MKRRILFALAFGIALPLIPLRDDEAEDKAQAAELARKLQNPVASLLQVPFRNNWDFGIGSAKAPHYTANVQPVVPFSLNEDWNLVTRTAFVVVAPPVGVAVTALPAGATRVIINGVFHYALGGIHYRPAFRNGVTVYTTVQL